MKAWCAMIRALLFCISHRQMPHRSQALRRKQNAGKMKTRKHRMTPHESVRVTLLSVNECVYSCGLGLGGMVCKGERVCLPHVFVMSTNAFCPLKRRPATHSFRRTLSQPSSSSPSQNTPVQYRRIVTADTRSTISLHCSV